MLRKTCFTNIFKEEKNFYLVTLYFNKTEFEKYIPGGNPLYYLPV